MKEIKSDYFELFPSSTSKDLLVICSSADIKKGKFSFYKNGKLLNINVLYINCPMSNWYRNGIPGIYKKGMSNLDAFKDFLDSLKNSLKIEKLFFMGISMGAYGAILLGTLNRADKILAFSGEPLLGLPGGKTEVTRNEFWPLYPDLRVLKFHNVTALFGELNIADTLGAYIIQEHSETNKIYKVPFANHDVAVKLQERGKLLDIVKRFINDEDLSIPDYVESYEISKSYCDSILRINRFFVKSEWGNILKTIRSFPSEIRSNLLYIYLESMALYKLNFIEESKLLIFKCLLKESRSEGFWSLLASIYLKQNNLNMALKAINISLNLKPALSLNNLIKSNILFKMGKFKEASIFANYANTINPSTQSSNLIQKLLKLDPGIEFEKFQKFELVKQLDKNAKNLEDITEKQILNFFEF